MMDAVSLAFLHAQIHRTGEGCCCPGSGVLCPGCPTHTKQVQNRIEALESQIAALETKLARLEGTGKDTFHYFIRDVLEEEKGISMAGAWNLADQILSLLHQALAAEVQEVGQ